ncbi:DinB superfamily protein [Mucilaginibacter lappiensis]|uniref:DinB-like domain-containing protein n=1 Tax=Mucilaginibacter lappiensis TaxID=354630 RepID=A0ABR6PDD7_9SPHI|nr:DinB family protein [Mucilaginibacter lappiensis]MBB6107770.1 hypothetical protein [Mucilaginibacter lappiensis]SIP97715.1 DinB superfamily protein [Mucilaginibacter lappiensis]
MEKETEIARLAGELENVVEQTIAAWQLQNRKVNGLWNKLSPEEILTPLAPGRNRAIYLLGHVIAFNDMMFPKLGFGERLHPELDHMFVGCSDGCANSYPAATSLKAYWYEVNEKLASNMHSLPPSQWLTQVATVEKPVFERNPLYNKLSIVIGQTVHLSYHIGQLNLLF